MAVIYNKSEYSNIMTLPKSTGRSFGAPLDPTAVWRDQSALETYAASDATAYVGQIVVLSTDTKTEAFIISDTAGTLVKLAATTASGDLASDVATLQGQVRTLIEKVGAAAEGNEVATGLYALIDAAKAAADAADAKADTKVASVAAADNSVTIGGTATAPTVQVKIDAADGNALTLSDAGLKVTIPEVVIPEYTVVKAASPSGEDFIASYELQKDGQKVGVSIDIPKDLVVDSGAVVTKDSAGAWGAAGTYICLTLANQTEPIYINVADLIEYVTVDTAKNDDMVVLAITNDQKISASIKDASVTRAKLATDVTDSLDKADSALQESDIVESAVNGSIKVGTKDVAIHGLGQAAFTEPSAYDVAGAASGVKSELVGLATDTSDKNTLYGVKKYAEEKAAEAQTAAGTAAQELVNGLNADIVSASAGEVISSVKQENGVVVATKKTLAQADIPELPISKITDLSDTLGGKVAKVSGATAGNIATLTAEGAIADSGKKASDFEVAGAAAAAKTAVLGEEGYTGTVKGAYEAAAAASQSASANASAIVAINNETTGILKQAKDYADGLASGYDAAGTAQSLINALDKADTAVAGEVVSAVSQEDGVITVSRRALVAADIPSIDHTKISDWATELGKKQDNLVFNTAYNAESNKVATMSDVSSAVAGLSGAMHFRGEAASDPTADSFDKSGYASGDVVLFGQKEFVFNGTSFILLGDEGSYAVKGAISNDDIANNAAIAQSKIANLTTDLAARVQGIKLAGQSAAEAMDAGVVTLPFATAAKAGLVVSSTAENKIAVGTDGTMEVNSVNIQKLTQTEGDMLVFNCGTSANL